MVAPTAGSIHAESVPGFIKAWVGIPLQSLRYQITVKPTNADMGAISSLV